MKYFYTTLILTMASLIFLASGVIAMPQFAASTGQNCNSCHVNPTGCWMRNTYGSQSFAQMDLPMHKTGTDLSAIFKSALTDKVSIGADARTMYLYRSAKADTLTLKTSTFFQMEGNFYINAQLTDKFTFTYFMDHSSEGTKYQIWGIANMLPFNGYIRAGRFQPAFGWRLADHTAFVRGGAAIWPQTYSDVGMEIGLYPSIFSFNVGLFNGNDIPIDVNNGKALAARIEVQNKFSFMNFAAGGSFWRNEMGSATNSMYGPFYYLGFLDGKLTYLGEIDWLKNIHSDSLRFVTTHNLYLAPVQGVWVNASYDYLDPNTKIKSGSTNRIGIGLNIFPISYMEIEPMFRYYTYSFGSGIPKNHTTEFQMKFHFFF